jgi:uncharacterized membrane protein
MAMRVQKTTPDRLGTFSDGVIAVIIPIMVLERRASASALICCPLLPYLTPVAPGGRL